MSYSEDKTVNDDGNDDGEANAEPHFNMRPDSVTPIKLLERLRIILHKMGIA